MGVWEPQIWQRGTQYWWGGVEVRGAPDSHWPNVHCCLQRRLEKLHFFFLSSKLKFKRAVENEKGI